MHHAARLPALLLLLALGACATTPTLESSGIRTTGHGLYAVYVSMQGGAASDYTVQTRTRAASEADAFCGRRGEGLAVVSSEQQLHDRHSAVVLDFSCGG